VPGEGVLAELLIVTNRVREETIPAESGPNNLHRRNKAISKLGFGMNKVLPVGMTSQGLSKGADVEGKAVFLDDRIGPHTLDKRFLWNDMARILDKHEKRFEDFGS
jgi:hypothetical protein